MIAAVLVLAGPLTARSEEGTRYADISADTVWEGTVVVTEPTRVTAGATLLVLPGTTVRFKTAAGGEGTPQKAGLIVHGVLVAQGTPERPILFTSGADSPTAGDWAGIVFSRSKERPSRLRNCRVEYAETGIRGDSSALTLEEVALRHNGIGLEALRDLNGGLLGCDISENGIGLAFHQSTGLLVEQCTIARNTKGGVVCLLGSTPRLTRNQITDNAGIGVSCLQGSSPLLEGNLIRGNDRGVHVELKSRPLILHNEIVENARGIGVEKLAFPVIVGNLISRNKVGIYCNFSGYPEIHDNDIFDNGLFSLVLGDNQSIQVEKLIPFRDQGRFYDQAPPSEFLPPQTKKYTPFTATDQGIVDARGNWWGEKIAREMAGAGEDGNISAIEDVHDKPDTVYNGKKYPRDRVVFSPWESAPVAAAGRPATKRSGIAGKIVFAGKPLAGARVHVYPDAEGNFRGEGLTYTAPAGADGAYSIALAPGNYYLVAKLSTPPFPHVEPEPGGYFGYYGANPVTVPEGGIMERNLQVVRRAASVVESGRAADAAVIQGKVSGPEGPVAGAVVHVYTDASRQFRGPDLFGPQGAVPGGTDDKGEFSIEVPAGSYYLVASKRQAGDMLGPLHPGDLHGYFDGNPLTLAAGTNTAVTVQVVVKLRDTSPADQAGAGETGIRGKIRDAAGTVPAGVYAFATTDPSFMIGAMPPYRSQPLGADGSFFIAVPAGGTYYVSARSGYGGPPLPGEWHGFHGSEKLAPVTVEKDRVTAGIDFVIKRME